MLRCTKKLVQRLNLPTRAPEVQADSAPPRLGDWYTTYIASRPKHQVFALSERCRLSILLPSAPLSTLKERFLAAVEERLRGLGVAPEAIQAELLALQPLTLAPTGPDRSRSTLGAMNLLLPVVEDSLYDEDTPEAIMDYLDSYLVRDGGAKNEYIHPGEATRALFGVEPESEKILVAIGVKSRR